MYFLLIIFSITDQSAQAILNFSDNIFLFLEVTSNVASSVGINKPPLISELNVKIESINSFSLVNGFGTNFFFETYFDK